MVGLGGGGASPGGAEVTVVDPVLRRRGEDPPCGAGTAARLAVVEAQAGRSERLLGGRRRKRGGEGVGVREVRPLLTDLRPVALLCITLLLPDAVVVLSQAADDKATDLPTTS